MTTVNESWTWEELGLEYEYEKAREQWVAYSAKSELLNDMLSDLYVNKDFESDIVSYLQKKRDVVREQRDKFYDVQKYLRNLKNDYPFHVRSTVGRCMTKYGLTKEQAEIFLNVHRSHMAAMGTENQNKYARYNIKKIIWSNEEDCLHVHYDDIWWHYDRRGQWW